MRNYARHLSFNRSRFDICFQYFDLALLLARIKRKKDFRLVWRCHFEKYPHLVKSIKNACKNNLWQRRIRNLYSFWFRRLTQTEHIRCRNIAKWVGGCCGDEAAGKSAGQKTTRNANALYSEARCVHAESNTVFLVWFRPNMKKIVSILLAPCCLAVGLAQSNVPNPLLTVAPLETLRQQMKTTIASTKPDFVVFIPKVTGTEVSDTGNEHFLVFDGPDKSLMAVWTQSTREGAPNQHIVFSRSDDRGKTWVAPRVIAGPANEGEKLMASWGFPLVSKRGRIYVLYSQNVGKFDTFPHTTGQLTGIFSDDYGKKWSTPQIISLPRTSRDNPDASFPPNCITWQKPARLTRDGRYLVGLTRWTSKAVKQNPTKSWITHESVVEFLRFENLDDDPEPARLKISTLAWDNHAVTVLCPDHPETSVVQEPSIVKLPDGRLFCVMRTPAGSPYWTLSSDDGDTWASAQALRRSDDGHVLKHPLSPCPIFDLGGSAAGSGHYALFIHNHDGHYQSFGPTDSNYHRRPIYKVTGHFHAGARQPIWFDEPTFFMDHDGVALGVPGKQGRIDLSLYSSVTMLNAKPVLWYPDRKFFLLGKSINSDN